MAARHWRQRPADRQSRCGTSDIGKLAIAAAILLPALTGCRLAHLVRPDYYPAELARFYTQQIDWGACDGVARDEVATAKQESRPDVQCATVLAPLDYDHPGGDTVRLALSRKPATGARIGSLLLNPGGPGAPGLGMIDVGNGTTLEQRFDRIGFDPRGIGASTPAITCGDPAAYAGPAETVEQIEQQERDEADHCAQLSGKALLTHAGAAEVARDMDIVRAALGEAKLTFVGYSYGTRLGWTYAERFPDRVRALVLDGAVAPDQDVATRELNQEKAFQHAFELLAAQCARFGDCPLGADPQQATDRFHDLTLPLLDHPLRSPGGRTLGYDDVQRRTDVALYGPESWDAYIAALRALRGGDPDPMLRLPAHLGDTETPDQLSDDAHDAIRCVDDPGITDPDVADRHAADLRAAGPFEHDPQASQHEPRDLCAFWPVPATGQPHRLNIPGLPTVVVVSTTDDPATPYQAGVDLAAQLHANLLTFQGTRHTIALNGVSHCIDDRVLAYLTDLRLPGDRKC